MSWLEKVKIVHKQVEEDSNLAVVAGFPVIGARRELIEQALSRFPFLPNAYVELLRLFDGLQLDWFVFLSLGGERFPSVESRLAAWRSVVDFEFFPVAEDFSGNLYCLDEKGKVILVPQPAFGGPAVVCESFDELMDEYLTGTRFFDLFPDGHPENEWTALLRERGWLG